MNRVFKFIIIIMKEGNNILINKINNIIINKINNNNNK